MFEWDTAKEKTNIEKHNISFVEATEIFYHNYLARLDSRKEYGEERYNALGISSNYALNVTYVIREGRIRIISARTASQAERKMLYDFLLSTKK